eukprot:XP_020393709.1 small nuclear ribonucleoprotein-associated protein N-like [Zea mays]
MKDPGALRHFLCSTAERRPQCLFLHQRQYAIDILEQARMSNCKPCSTPVDTQTYKGVRRGDGGARRRTERAAVGRGGGEARRQTERAVVGRGGGEGGRRSAHRRRRAQLCGRAGGHVGRPGGRRPGAWGCADGEPERGAGGGGAAPAASRSVGRAAGVAAPPPTPADSHTPTAAKIRHRWPTPQQQPPPPESPPPPGGSSLPGRHLPTRAHCLPCRRPFALGVRVALGVRGLPARRRPCAQRPPIPSRRRLPFPRPRLELPWCPASSGSARPR